MSIANLEANVAQFMDVVGQTIRRSPQNLPNGERILRIDLITEEYDETLDALLKLGNPNIDYLEERKLIAEVADGVADLIYVLLGTTIAMGVNMQEVWDAVQDANMAKVSGPVREDGKHLKPEGWRPPDIEGLIRDQQL